MDERGKILSDLIIRKRLSSRVIPEIQPEPFDGDIPGKFIASLHQAGGEGYLVKKKDLALKISALFPGSQAVFNHVTGLDLKESIPLNTDDLPGKQNIEFSILPAGIGVAENGAIWLESKHFFLPEIPFLSDNLVIILQANRLVYDMIQAYKHLDLRNISYGVFISGPSKTADIEQSLVIGAQGPSRHVVLLAE